MNEFKLTGPTKPNSEVLVKGLSLMGTPEDDNGTVCNKMSIYTMKPFTLTQFNLPWLKKKER